MKNIEQQENATAGLGEEELAILRAVKSHCERLLDHTPRFKYFTLHGAKHLNSLFEILAFIRNGGVVLSREEVFLLSLAICIHDLGMVVPLRDMDIRVVLDGRSASPDPTAMENYIRERHHELVDKFLENDLGFLVSLGITLPQIGLVREISKCHRKTVLQGQHGIVRNLGALLRVIDELDIGTARAPADVFRNISDEMDGTSCWHWFKHLIAITSSTVTMRKTRFLSLMLAL